ncbi:Arf GTPase activating protein domain-containing protein [Paramicrosporidium saccamoebae]|uniref:Arf GTPase activating protein domain-containing protein n=1 Tax=Paramicrosporidium saccamoebae TaxID=1246581 RepID=A0A2H9TM12_9FUNG|nr:Arf GTPase activating protein domain-containing protein [Paramicrosporidium saccamoebae]
MVEGGNAKSNAIYNPNPERFAFPAYSGDMEQYIRDKYERKLFMGGESRASAPKSRGSIPNGSVSSNAERYPLQIKSLGEMGFSDPAANSAALAASNGNLQEAIESLLAGKRGSPTGLQRSPAPKSTSPVDDLVDIFGALPPPSRSPPQQAPQSTSILDLDLPPPPTVENGAASDDFEEFESASASQAINTHEAPLEKKRSSVSEPPKVSPALKSIASVAPDLNNPWASGSNGNGDAFDDIDPFRGFTSSHK